MGLYTINKEKKKNVSSFCALFHKHKLNKTKIFVYQNAKLAYQ